MPHQLEFDYDVFISYSSHDKEWVRGDLLKGIEKAGVRAFIDFRDFKPGAPSIKEMERGVTTCRKTLLVLSPDYIESGWCEIENIMLQTLDPANRELRLVPLLKTRCKPPLRIGALSNVDFTDGSDFDLAWHQLLTALDALPELPAEKAIPTEIQAELDRAKSFTDADKFSEAIPILEKALTAADGSGHTAARVKIRSSLAHAKPVRILRVGSACIGMLWSWFPWKTSILNTALFMAWETCFSTPDGSRRQGRLWMRLWLSRN